MVNTHYTTRSTLATFLAAALLLALTIPVSADMRDKDPERRPAVAIPAQDKEDAPNLTSICGEAELTAEQMRAYLRSVNVDAPDYVDIYLEEGEKEGVRGDVAFAMSCLETGNFRFGGDVRSEQNNFCGLGATGGVPGLTFDTPEEGIRAQIQHMKAYATTDNLNKRCVDPRFRYVSRGIAPYVEWLGIPENPSGKGWAAGKGYGDRILEILERIRDTEIPTPL